MEEQRLLKKKQRADECGNLEQLAHYCRELGDHYRKIGKYNEALQQFKQEEKTNVVLSRPIAVAVSCRMIGEIYCDIGDFREAIKYQEKHLAIAKKEANGIEEQRALANLGRTYFCMAEAITKSDSKEYDLHLSSAKKVYIRSLALCDDIQGIGHLVQTEMRARLLLNIGLVLECQGSLDEAIEYIRKAIKIAEQCDLSEELFRCHSALGALYHRRGDNCERALECLNVAVAQAERLEAGEKQACEALSSKAEVLFTMADFEGAKQALLKAYKLHTPDGNERLSIEKNLRIAAKLCETERRVLSTDAGDHKALMPLYETMGDGVVAIGNFKKAIEYYLKMLECAEMVGDSGRALCPIYVSLAQTYKDICEYDLALKYSRKELEISKDAPQEACKTMLSISELLELKKAPYVEVAASYLQAKEFAMQAQDWKLLVTTLRCLQSYQENSGLGDLAEDTEKERQEVMKLHSSENEEESGSEEEGSTFGGSINLDELAESESEGDTHSNQLPNGERRDRRSKRLKGTGKGLAVQRNEKGETALHRACIAGNVNLVQRLIERGHPINVRDHCGWSPLHEACNHGHEDIVSALIASGAQLNDRGGTHCGGVTPIHDAASCGHLSILRILLSAGALLMVRTDKGETPLDCLRQWFGRVQGELDVRTEEEFRELEQEMARSLDKIAGQQPPEVRHPARTDSQPKSSESMQRGMSGSEPLSIVHRGRRGSRGLLCRKKQDEIELSTCHSSSEDDVSAYVSSDEEPVLIPSKMMARDICQQEIDNTSRYSRVKGKDFSASSEYARTIASLKNRQSLLTLSKAPKGEDACQLLFGKEKAPLLGENEVEVDDWLEDDVGGTTARPPSKRMRKHTWGAGPWRGKESLTPPLPSTDSPEGGSGEPGLEKRQGESSEQGMVLAMAATQQLMSQSPEELTPSWYHQRQPPSLHASIQLIKVDVEGTLLLVPLNGAATFECLANEVARRYHDFKGVNVELTLHTQEGAMLSKNDPTTLLSSLCGVDPQAMTLVAKVTSLTLPPIGESYEKACMANYIDLNEEVGQSLEVCQAIHSLTLDDLGLGPKEFGAVVQVLSQHRNLTIRRLSLASNNIGDKGLKVLCDGLFAMQSLVVLDLSCNNISEVGLSDLAAVFTQQCPHSNPLQGLAELNLSHNPIKDTGFSYLVTVVSELLSLTCLSLRDCSLSAADGSTVALSLASVEQLDVSFNALGAEGVATFLATLQPARLRVLNVSRTLRRSPGSRKIAREVALLLTQDEMSPPSNLVELDLSQTQSNDLDIYEVMRGLEHANLLERLSLECNPDLTLLTLRRLLQLGPSLLHITLSGCPRIFDFMEMDAMRCGMQRMQVDPLMPGQVHLSVGQAADEVSVKHLVELWERMVGRENAIVERGLFGHLQLGSRRSLVPHETSVPCHNASLWT